MQTVPLNGAHISSVETVTPPQQRQQIINREARVQLVKLEARSLDPSLSGLSVVRSCTHGDVDRH